MTTSREEEVRLLFTEARTHNGWLAEPVDDAILRRIYELARWGPTSANTQPLRVLFVRSAEAKEKLRPALSPGNVDKTMAAPATAVLAYDAAFYEKMPKLFPARPQMAVSFGGMPVEKRDRLAFQSATLQAGYFILAARALGLDCGPMGGFDTDKVDAAFFAGSTWRSTLLVNLGHGDGAKVHPRNPRLEFDEACRIE